MEIKRLDKEELRRAYAEVFTEAFPPQELKPLSAIEDMMDAGIYDPIGLFENGEALGFICLWLDRPYVLIDYLCVNRKARNGGIGGKLITRTIASYPEDAVFIGEVEAPTGDPERDGIILRRLGFYDRCGAKQAGYDCALYGVHYKTIIWSKGDVDREELMRRHAKFYSDRLRPEVYSEAIQIPFLPGDKLKSFDAWIE